MYGRLDVEKEQAGLALCRNFVVLPHGPVQNRAGTHYVAGVKNAGNLTRVIPFSFNNSQTMAIELGAGYFRFHPDESTLLAASNPELLLNNVFALGPSTDWTPYNSGTSTFTGTGQCVMTSTSSSVPALYQTFSTVVGQSYDVMVTLNGVGKINVESLPGFGDITSRPLNTTAMWGASLTFVAVGTSTTVRISGSAHAVATYGGASVRESTPEISPYDSYTVYAVGQAVRDVAGNAYYCLQPTLLYGDEPSNSAYFYPLPNLIYELPNSYAAADLMSIHYVQSGDIVTLVHPNYPPAELERFNDLQWVLTTISFASSIAAPAAPTATAVHLTGGYPINFQYIVTALDAYGNEESLPSPASGSISNDLTIAGNYNVITWAAVTGAGYYNLYKSFNGVFGYIGQVPASTLGFYDRNVTADFTKSIPQQDSTFKGASNYPTAVGYYEQRKVFGGTNTQPQNLWMTQSGTESNMNYNVPSQDSDALRVRIAALRANYIEHIVPLLDLIVLTASTEWRVYTASGDALTPSTISIKAQSQNGANNVQPVVVDNTGIYGASQGGHIRSISYQWQMQGYQSTDLCLLATHLFNNHTIVDLAFSRSPYPILWAVNEQGALLGMTYLPDQQVSAWHQHWTGNGDGFFESICTITENGFDVLYAVVRRVVNGATVRYIESLDTRQYAGVLKNAYFVDCGIAQTFSGPVSTVSGLTWLIGKTVSVLGDGVVQAQQVVSSTGVVNLATPATTVIIGLPIVAQFQTVPASVAGDASMGQGRVKNINKVWARCVDFCGCMVGPSATQLVPVAPLAYDGNGNPALANGEFRVNVLPSFGEDGMVLVSQLNPLPLTVVDLTMEVAIGG